MATREETDALERGPTPEELADEIRCFEAWQDEQDRKRMDRVYTARWHHHLARESA